MGITTISLKEEELMRLESIFLDKDKEEALRFLLEVIKPKLRAKGSQSLDLKRGLEYQDEVRRIVLLILFKERRSILWKR
jgi:hypothetical protein